MENYLGRGENFWRIHGLLCNNTYENGSGYDFSGDGTTMEPELDSCLVFYSVIETVHASVFIFLAVSSILMYIVCMK